MGPELARDQMEQHIELMNRHLQIFRAKPNPVGKDKVGNTPKAEQLLGEWVDIKNVGTESVPFRGMSLYHTIFDSRCGTAGEVRSYWEQTGDGVLPVGKILRIHTGRRADESVMLSEDKSGRDWFDFANEQNFVLNNRCGDRIRVVWPDSAGKIWKDEASYAPALPEGVILVRQGDVLVYAASRGY